MRFTSQMHEALEKEAENTHSQHPCQEDQTALYSAANAECSPHSQYLCREAEIAQCSAAAIKQSSQRLLASSAPPIGCRVT